MFVTDARFGSKPTIPKHRIVHGLTHILHRPPTFWPPKSARPSARLLEEGCQEEKVAQVEFTPRLMEESIDKRL
jgi:hypothetical protein